MSNMSEWRLKILRQCDKCDKSSKLKPLIIGMSLNKLLWVSNGFKKKKNMANHRIQYEKKAVIIQMSVNKFDWVNND